MSTAWESPSPGLLAGWAQEFVTETELSIEEAYLEANRLIIEENWVEAESLMAQLYASEPTNRNFAYKWALCLRGVPGKLAEAVPLVHFAVDGPFANRYNAFSTREVLPPEDALELGLEVLQHAYHFAEAQALAEVIVSRYSKRDFRHIRALEVIDECAFAMNCVRTEVRMEIAPEVVLNSSSADYAPVVTPDGNTMYFTSHRAGVGRADVLGKIYRSTKNDGGWSKPVMLSLGSPGRDITTVGVMGDNEALFAYQGYRNEGSIWKLMRDDAGGWMKEEKVGFPVDSRHWETSMTERFDGWERIFVSDRPGGHGGRDLYRTVRLPDGTWSEPLNLGLRINTSGDEESPFLSADGQVLLFASQGHPGMGGFDLYRCRRLDNGSWSDPEHLGHPLNTPGNEAVISLDASGAAGFISSTRAGGYDLDIYRVEFLEDAGEELAVMIGEVPGWMEGDVMEVKSTDNGSAIFRVFRARKGSGKFLAALPPCRTYAFSWVRNGKAMLKRTESVGCDEAYGAEHEVKRLAPFIDGVESLTPASEAPNLDAVDPGEGIEAERDVVEAEPDVVEAEPDVVEAEPGVIAEDSSGAFNLDSAERTGETGASREGDSEEREDKSVVSQPEEPLVSPAAPVVTMLEFEAVSEMVDFGYGKYITQTGSREVVSMALSIMERNEAGEIPVLQIEGSASFVPIKNKRAYESNEQLAKMRAEKARDAMIMELAKRGLQVGVDYQIVLEWGVAGPQYKGDAAVSSATYRNYQFAKFSLARTLVEQRR